MTPFEQFLIELFQQYGFVGLIVFFLIVGPGFTYFRTRSIRVQTEAKAQELLNCFMQQEHERAGRLEARLEAATQQLDSSETEVSQLRLRLADAQACLDEMPRLKHRVRHLNNRVTELETVVKDKQMQIDALQRELASSRAVVRSPYREQTPTEPDLTQE